MKKILTLLIFTIMLFSSDQIFSQISKKDFQNKIFQGKLLTASENLLGSNLSKILLQLWKSENWEDARRVIYSYNESGNLVSIVYDSLDGGNWKTIMEMVIEYNPSDLILKDYFYIRELDGNIEFGTMHEYSYTGNLIDEVMQYSWAENSNDWELISKEMYEYSNELVSKTSTYMWEDNDWVPSMETDYSYDNQNREVESISKFWDPSENLFVNNDRTITEYYKDEKISRIENKSWDFMTEQWSEDNYFLSEFNYDTNDNQIEYIYTSAFGFGGFSIEIKSRSTYQYDSNNLKILQNDYNWDEIAGSWSEIAKIEFTYNNGGLLIQDIYYSFDGANYNNQEKNLYEYGTAVDVKLNTEMPKRFELYQNYPNPFNPSTIISYRLSEASSVELKIYDLLGNEINLLVNEVQPAGDYKIKFDAKSMIKGSKLSSGIYIISLKSGNKHATRKCLLLK